MWLFKQHGDKGRLSRWGLLMSQWHIVAVPNKEQAGLYNRSLSHEAGSKMHAPDCGSRMFDTNDGGQLPPEGREDITLHITHTTSMRFDGGYMDLEHPMCANVLDYESTRSGTPDDHLPWEHADQSVGIMSINMDNAEPMVPDIGANKTMDPF